MPTMVCVVQFEGYGEASGWSLSARAAPRDTSCTYICDVDVCNDVKRAAVANIPVKGQTETRV